MIRSYQYLQDARILVITFLSGKSYQYFDITAAEYAAFTEAFSKGTYFNKYIKPYHAFKLVA